VHGLPSDFNASPFVGRILDVVSFSANNTHFNFDDDVSITVEGSYSHVSPSGGAECEVPVDYSELMQLVGESVLVAEASEDGTLDLLFSNKQRLIVYDNSVQYEAYRITIRGQETIV
jgi:hypothetical protein